MNETTTVPTNTVRRDPPRTDIQKILPDMNAGVGDLVESLVAERKEAADRIAALEAEKAERMNWQPIETAPKDGTNVLLYREAGNMFIVGYFDNAHGWVDGECIAPVAGPDYWCKLEPPK